MSGCGACGQRGARWITGLSLSTVSAPVRPWANCPQIHSLALSGLLEPTVDGSEQGCSRLTELPCRLGVGVPSGVFLKRLQGESRLEILQCRGERDELLQRGSDQVLGVVLGGLAFGIGAHLGKQARPVKVDIGVEVLTHESVDLLGEVLRDVSVA